MESNTLEKSSNESLALIYFACTLSMIRWIVRIWWSCELIYSRAVLILPKNFLNFGLDSKFAFLGKGGDAVFYPFLFCVLTSNNFASQNLSDIVAIFRNLLKWCLARIVCWWNFCYIAQNHYVIFTFINCFNFYEWLCIPKILAIFHLFLFSYPIKVSKLVNFCLFFSTKVLGNHLWSTRQLSLIMIKLLEILRLFGVLGLEQHKKLGKMETVLYELVEDNFVNEMKTVTQTYNCKSLLNNILCRHINSYIHIISIF